MINGVIGKIGSHCAMTGELIREMQTAGRDGHNRGAW